MGWRGGGALGGELWPRPWRWPLSLASSRYKWNQFEFLISPRKRLASTLLGHLSIRVKLAHKGRVKGMQGLGVWGLSRKRGTGKGISKEASKWKIYLPS